MRKTLVWMALLTLLAACGASGGGAGTTCPGPAEFDHAGCTYGAAGTTFGL